MSRVRSKENRIILSCISTLQKKTGFSERRRKRVDSRESEAKVKFEMTSSAERERKDP